MEYLSNIELYYSVQSEGLNSFTLTGDEFKHIIKVMRHSVGDEVYITNGYGNIFLTVIKEIRKDSLTASVKETITYKNNFANIYFCIPKLKSTERLEIALEKSTELGITNFIIFNSERTFHKSSKMKRWQKILLSAMKQSLRSYLPNIEIVNSLNEILNLDGRKILLEQNSEKKISGVKINPEEKYYFIFGPEGGFSKEEISLFDEEFKLAENRLRTETAIIKCASIIMEYGVLE